jgi:hypothetical protein
MPVSISGDGAITGLELEAFEDVDVGSGASDGDVLTYDASGDLWIPQGIVPISGIGLNVVQTVKSDTLTTTSMSFVDITGMEVTIAPSSATAKVLVFVDLAAQGFIDTNGALVKLRRDTTDIYIGDAAGSRERVLAMSETGTGNISRNTAVFLDSPSSAVSVTYSLQIRNNVSGQTVYVNRTRSDTDSAVFGRVASSITAIEVAA